MLHLPLNQTAPSSPLILQTGALSFHVNANIKLQGLGLIQIATQKQS